MFRLYDMIYNGKTVSDADKAKLALFCSIDYNSIISVSDSVFDEDNFLVLNCEVDASKFIPIVDMSGIYSLDWFLNNNASIIDLTRQDLRGSVSARFLFEYCSTKTIRFNSDYKLRLDATGMFCGCYNLESLDLSMIDLLSYDYIFFDCYKLKHVKLNKPYFGMETLYPDIYFEVIK